MFVCGAYSDRGRKEENQDALLFNSAYGRSDSEQKLIDLGSIQKHKPLVALLADGVSSCKKPRQASALALEIINQKLLQNLSSESDLHMESCIAASLSDANNVLYFSDPYERQSALLSTLTGIVFENNSAHIFNVGDSRVYRFYQNKLECLTRDQNHQSGLYKGALASALGADCGLNSQYFKRTLLEGELYFIASDGIHTSISDDELKLFFRETETHNSTPKLNQIMQKIGQAAYANGSHDNLSCMAVYIQPSSNKMCSTHDFLQRKNKQFSPELNTHDTLDNFLILRELQSSPRSHIYLAQDLQSKEHRTIKVPSEYFRDDQVSITRFLKEEKIGLGFDHSSILKFYPKPLDSNYIYHVTEYIEGYTLRDYMNTHGPLSLRVSLDFISKIVIGLRVLHRSHLLHQDLKPENIMLTMGGEIKLIDLGAVGSLILQDHSSAPPGDLEYTAPEYYYDKPRGVYSDLFSLAIVAYEMLTGTVPFSSQQISNAQKNLSFKAPHLINPNLPKWLEPIFSRAFRAEPTARYQALSEFVSDLDPDNHNADLDSEPLLTRNPILFWKLTSLLFFLSSIGMLIYFTQH